MASYTVKHSKESFTPTYEDGLWVGDCYCVRVLSTVRKPATGSLYDLSIENQHYYQVNGVVVHNSGDIHEELRVTNVWPTPKQTVESANLLVSAVKAWAPHYPVVRVEFITEDNHSRLTKKPQAKEAGVNCFNYLVGMIAQARLANQKNVQFNVHPMYQKTIEVKGRRYLITHGHNVKGWAGFPYYGIERKAGREAIKRMMKNIGKFDKIILGHWHAPLAHPWYWIGASAQGTDAYDHQNGRFAEPAQSLWFVHPEHGEFDRTDFQLKT